MATFWWMLSFHAKVVFIILEISGPKLASESEIRGWDWRAPLRLWSFATAFVRALDRLSAKWALWFQPYMQRSQAPRFPMENKTGGGERQCGDFLLKTNGLKKQNKKLMDWSNRISMASYWTRILDHHNRTRMASLRIVGAALQEGPAFYFFPEVFLSYLRFSFLKNWGLHLFLCFHSWWLLIAEKCICGERLSRSSGIMEVSLLTVSPRKRELLIVVTLCSTSGLCSET